MGYLDLALQYTSQMRIVDTPASGGGLSQNGKFSYGYASSAGKRSSMEDFYETRIDGVDGETVGLFGVFDGHGGARAAEYVKQNLFSNLISHPKFISDTKSAIADAYNHTDSELLKAENSQSRDAGSTASTAILVGDRLLVANVGDSRAVICKGGNAIAVSRDHKPDQTDERERIENAGGFVMWAGTWRVGGVLAVSRAFGDRLLKQYVVADPEIKEEKIDSSLEFLILASDGLWDVVSNEEAVSMVKEIEDAEEAAKKLVTEAIQRGSADNITCVTVRFRESKMANKTTNASSSRCNSAIEADQEKNAVRGDSDHSSLAKEANKGQIEHTKSNPEQMAVHSNLDRSKEAKQGLITDRSDSNRSSLAKEANKGQIAHTKAKPEQIAVHSDSNRSKEANQGLITDRSDSNRSSLEKEANRGQIAHSKAKPEQIAVHSDSHRSKEAKQGLITDRSDSNRSSLAKEANKGQIAHSKAKPEQIAVHSDSHHSSLAKEAKKGQIAHTKANPEQIAFHSHSNHSKEAKQGLIPDRSDSTHNSLAKGANKGKIAHTKANPEQIAIHSDSTRPEEAKQRLIPDRSDSDHRISAKDADRRHTDRKESGSGKNAICSDLNRGSRGEGANQSSIAVNSDSGRNRNPTNAADQILIAARSKSGHNNTSTNAEKQKAISTHKGSGVSSESGSRTATTNQKPIADSSDSDLRDYAFSTN